MYYLNKACEIQLAASSLRGVREMPSELSTHACEQFQASDWQRHLVWEAWLRKLERECPEYKD
ncbi:aldolase II superfamily protein [compost metagenome]